MSLDSIPLVRRLSIPYNPDPNERSFRERAQTQTKEGLEVHVAVLSSAESRKYFGVPMARRGIQPVWLKIVNHNHVPYRLNLIAIDPNYYSPHEAAAACHFSGGKRILYFGLFAWLFFLPILLILPFKLFAARRVNRSMDRYFQSHSFHLRPVLPGNLSEGFVFTNLDAGNKILHIRLLGPKDIQEFVFSVPVPGLDTDYLKRGLDTPVVTGEVIDCDAKELMHHLSKVARATSNQKGQREGDPLNLVLIGEFPTILSAFGARWDETEIITLATCWKTFRAFLFGSPYRYSPVSALYLNGASQDFALQRTRHSINERLHLRMWTTHWRYQGRPVWVGQVSRDIGVRFTWRTWNLTTHRIDPDVDEARDYVVEDLLQAGRLEMAGYLDGVGACDHILPRHNLTGDPYFTDGKRAVILVSETRTTPKFLEWN